jgi:hypothetical protein
MSGKIRRLSSEIVRLRPSTLALVRRLANLASVSVSDVVDFVLVEVLHDEAIEGYSPSPAMPARPRRTATVIPIDRRRPRRIATTSEWLRQLDLPGLRTRAREVRDRSHAARERAQSARLSAAAARDRAAHALQL